MDIFRVCEVIFIVAVLVALRRLEKKQPKKAQWVEQVSFGGSLALAAPFALIQALSSFGIHLFDMPSWPFFTPLDVMGGMALVCFTVLSGKKLFGTIDTAMPAENE